MDVRDVAKAHRLHKKRKNLTVNAYRMLHWTLYIGFFRTARTVKHAVKDYGYKITTTEVPSLVLRILALFDPKIAVVRAVLNAKHQN